jgi:hypothetical protein
VGTVNNQKCYQLMVKNFPTTSDAATDQVRVDITMKSNLVRGSYLYRVGKKAFPAGETALEFNDWNDTTEITNKTWSVWP